MSDPKRDKDAVRGHGVVVQPGCQKDGPPPGWV